MAGHDIDNPEDLNETAQNGSEPNGSAESNVTQNGSEPNGDAESNVANDGSAANGDNESDATQNEDAQDGAESVAVKDDSNSNDDTPKGNAPDADNTAEMSFWDHIEVLRWALFRIAGVLGVLIVVCFIFMPWLFDHFIMAPTTSDFFLYRWMSSLGGGETGRRLMLLPNFSNPDFHVDIINIKVATQFLTHISTSFWLALVAAFPYIVFEIWRFIKPALYEREKKSILGGFVFGTVMFYLGCAVGYCIVFPFTFRFLTEYQISSEIVNQISLNSYMSNFLTMVFIMGVVFELPMLALVLSSLGILKKEMLSKNRRYAVVIIMVLAALITPSGDPFTLMIVFLPIYLLYELSILIVKS